MKEKGKRRLVGRAAAQSHGWHSVGTRGMYGGKGGYGRLE